MGEQWIIAEFAERGNADQTPSQVRQAALAMISTDTKATAEMNIAGMKAGDVGVF